MFSSSEQSRCSDCCKREKFVAIFFEKFAAVFERETAFARGRRAKKNKARSRRLFTAPESAADSMWLRCREASTSRREFFESRIADANSEVASSDIFQFVRFVEDHRSDFGKNAGVGRVFRLLLDAEIGKK